MNTPVLESFCKKHSIHLPDSIGLIIPPSGFLMDQRYFMTLGPLKVAAVLEAAGMHVEVSDLSGVKNYLDFIRDYVSQKENVHHFGITSTTPQLPDAMLIVQAIREVRSDVKIILGGPHATLVNASWKKEKLLGRTGRGTKAMNQLTDVFDVIVAGDGEMAVFLALAEKSPAIVDADVRGGELFLTDELFTNLPFPARHLVDVSSYHYNIDGVAAISLIAQLGCPFACGFCGGRESPMLRNIRTRTSQSIVDEMVFLHKTYGFNGFMMYDDELNIDGHKLVELMELIAKTQRDLGVEWRLRGFIKSQLFTDAQAKAMYAAGFRWILVGFESGSEEILIAINKKATRAENDRCMEIAKRHGLKVKALMSMGHPGESHDTVNATYDWLLKAKPDDFDMSIITCYPGTPYYDQALPNPDLDPGRAGDWIYTHQPTGAILYQKEVDFTTTAEYYKGDPNEGYKAYVATQYLSSADIVSLRGILEKDVRRKLGLPFSQGAAAINFEHSMGQRGGFPLNILRTSP